MAISRPLHCITISVSRLSKHSAFTSIAGFSRTSISRVY